MRSNHLNRKIKTTAHLFRVPWMQIGWRREHYFVKDLHIVRDIMKRRIEKKMKRTVSTVANQSVCRSPFHLRSHRHNYRRTNIHNHTTRPCTMLSVCVQRFEFHLDRRHSSRKSLWKCTNSMKKRREWIACTSIPDPLQVQHCESRCHWLWNEAKIDGWHPSAFSRCGLKYE